MDKIFNKNRGITLIALVIIIIVLVILGGVSISLVLNDNGIINRTKTGSKEYKEAQARERLEIVLAELLTDRVSNKDYNENEYLNNVLESNDVSVEGDVVIVDGWQFEIDRQTLQIVESLGEETGFIKATRKKANFVYDVEAKYLSEAEVEINVDESAKAYTIQYNTEESDENSSNWTTYTLGNKFKVSKNGTIYGRFIDLNTNEIGYTFKAQIANIDDINPESANIVLSATSVSTGGTIKATVTQNDNELGINITNCKYIVNTSSASIGVDSTSWNSATAFTSNPQTISVTKSEIKSYYLHVLSVDCAGNKVETISQKFKYTGVTTYLNRQLAAYNTLTGYTIYNSEESNYIRVEGTTKAYMVSNQMYDLTEIAKLQLYCEKLYVSSSSNATVTFGISKTKQSTNFDKCVQLTKNNPGSFQDYEITMNCDTSDITGSYYIKVMVQSTNSGALTTFSLQTTIKGY